MILLRSRNEHFVYSYFERMDNINSNSFCYFRIQHVFRIRVTGNSISRIDRIVYNFKIMFWIVHVSNLGPLKYTFAVDVKKR